MLVFAMALLGFAASLWTLLVCRKLYIKIDASKTRFFPGDTAEIIFRIKNDKWFPVSWVDMIQPLKEPFVLRPEEDMQAMMQKMSGDTKRLYGIPETSQGQLLKIRCSGISGNSSADYVTRWHACRRGIMTTREMDFCTGDGLGMTRCWLQQESSGKKDFIVYPEIVAVDTEAFTRNMWEGENSPKGILEDVSLIKLTRPYEAQDSLKKINWRMVARGQQMTVNQYEVIRPRKIHFIFDGESFNGETPHEKKLEDTLSILASLVLQLQEKGLDCGVSFPASIRLEPSDIFPGNEGVSEILYRMAEYEMRPPLVTYEVGSKEVVHVFRPSRFNEEEIISGLDVLGKCWFVTRNEDTAAASEFLKKCGDAVKVLTYEELKKLKRGHKDD